MTRQEVRRRKRRRQSLRRAAAWTVVFTAELLAAGLQAGAVAAILIPLAHKLRGYSSAVGGEWLLIGILFCGAFFIIHKQVCDKIFEEGKHG